MLRNCEKFRTLVYVYQMEAVFWRCLSRGLLGLYTTECHHMHTHLKQRHGRMRKVWARCPSCIPPGA